MSAQMKVLICDDEPGMRLILKKLVEKAEGFTVIGEAANGEEGLAIFEREHPSVVFLDVEMPGMGGIEAAQKMQDMDPLVALIFATAHEGYRSEAFTVYAFDYLVKPFKNERVLETLARVRVLLSPRPAVPQKLPARRRITDRLMLRSREGVSFVDVSDIILVQREDRQTVLYTPSGSYSASETLTDMEEKLPSDQFFRCHKSYIINLSCIESITPYGRWTYVVRLHGIKQDALITHDKYEELEAMFS